MSRFFVETDAADLQNGKIMITGEDVRHIANVLRASPGDVLVLCDGAGTDYDAVIERISKESIETSIRDSRPNNTEPPVRVTLFQGVPKSDKMDFIIQKCVELGVKQVVPVMTARSVVRFKNTSDAAAKTARWARIALEAAKQCDRGVIPVVREPVRLDEALKLAGGIGLKLFPYEEERGGSLRNVLKDYGKSMVCGNALNSVAVLIGPEGGFDRNEAERAVEAGFHSVTLGPRILRTETAGLATAAIVMYELGDMGGNAVRTCDHDR